MHEAVSERVERVSELDSETVRDAVSEALRSELAGVLNVPEGSAGYPGVE